MTLFERILHKLGLCWKARSYGYCHGNYFVMANGETGRECGRKHQ